MSEHTEGPWRFWTQRRPGSEDTCTFRNIDGVEVLRAVTVTLTEADAWLIAAAPDLLAALKMVLSEGLPVGPGYEAVKTIANAAIIKATRGDAA